MNRYRMVGIAVIALTIALVYSAFPVVAQLYERYQVAQRVIHWVAWSGTTQSPVATISSAGLELPEAATRLSGIVHYQNGHLGSRDAHGLPVRSVILRAAGMVLVIEDAYRSDAVGTHLYALPPQTRDRVLLARIVVDYDGHDEYTVAYRYYHFDRRAPIELSLPYELHLPEIPASAMPDTLIPFRASLGPIEATGKRYLIPEDDWEEAYEEGAYLSRAIETYNHPSVEIAMDNGLSGVRYAEVELLSDAGTPGLLAITGTHNMWRLNASAGRVYCEALGTGSMCGEYPIPGLASRHPLRGGSTLPPWKLNGLSW